MALTDGGESPAAKAEERPDSHEEAKTPLMPTRFGRRSLKVSGAILPNAGVAVVTACVVGINFVLAAALLQTGVPKALLNALFTALLTVAALIPAIIGLIIVERPSARMGRGRILWSGPLLALSVLALASLVLGLLGILARLGRWSPLSSEMLGGVAVAASVSLLIFLPFLFVILIQRSSARTSTLLVERRIARMTRDSKPRHQDGSRELLKELRDVALLEASKNDRRSVRERMGGLARIASTTPVDTARVALEELAFLGQHLLHDRDYALDSLNWISASLKAREPVTSEDIHLQFVHEYCSFWAQSLRLAASPRIADSASEGLLLTLRHFEATSEGSEEEGPPVFSNSSLVPGPAVQEEIHDLIEEVPLNVIRSNDLKQMREILRSAHVSPPLNFVAILADSTHASHRGWIADFLLESPSPKETKEALWKAFGSISLRTASGADTHPVASSASTEICRLLDSRTRDDLVSAAIETLKQCDRTHLDLVRGALFVQVADDAWRQGCVDALERLGKALRDAFDNQDVETISALSPGLLWRLRSSRDDLVERIRTQGLTLPEDRARRSPRNEADAAPTGALEQPLANGHYSTLYLRFFVQSWDANWRQGGDFERRKQYLGALRDLLTSTRYAQSDVQAQDGVGARGEEESRLSRSQVAKGSVPGITDSTVGQTPQATDSATGQEPLGTGELQADTRLPTVASAYAAYDELVVLCCKLIATRIERRLDEGAPEDEIASRTWEVLDLLLSQRNVEHSPKWLELVAPADPRASSAEELLAPHFDAATFDSLLLGLTWIHKSVVKANVLNMDTSPPTDGDEETPDKGGSSNEGEPQGSFPSVRAFEVGALDTALLHASRTLIHLDSQSHRLAYAKFKPAELELFDLSQSDWRNYLEWLEDRLLGTPNATMLSALRARSILQEAKWWGSWRTSKGFRPDPATPEQVEAAWDAIRVLMPGISPDLNSNHAWVQGLAKRVIVKFVLSLGSAHADKGRVMGPIETLSLHLSRGDIQCLTEAFGEAAFMARSTRLSRLCFQPFEALEGPGCEGVCAPMASRASTLVEGIYLLDVMIGKAPKEVVVGRVNSFAEGVSSLLSAGAVSPVKVALPLAAELQKEGTFFKIREMNSGKGRDQLARLIAIVMVAATALRGEPREAEVSRSLKRIQEMASILPNLWANAEGRAAAADRRR